jgi:hypothetical protein
MSGHETAPLTPTARLRAAVAAYFPHPEWSLAFEVSNGTGANSHRYADAVAMNMWPSRGLAIHGIEMKVSRSDWQRELSDPSKADEIHQHCDFWWLAAAPGVVKDINEIPIGWGYLALNEVKDQEAANAPRLRVKRQAAQIPGRPGDIKRSFVAAILRAHERADADATNRAIRAAASERVEREIKRYTEQQKRMESHTTQHLSKLTAKLGKNLTYLDDDEICRAVAFVIKTGAMSSYGGILGLIKSFEDADRSARQAIAAIKNVSHEFEISSAEADT